MFVLPQNIGSDKYCEVEIALFNSVFSLHPGVNQRDNMTHQSNIYIKSFSILEFTLEQIRQNRQ